MGDLCRVARYRREVGASLERAWENVRDWEHLPWLHRQSFSSIALVEEGDWGWRARAGLQPAAEGRQVLIELSIDPHAPRYVSRILEGPTAGTEIRTRFTRLDEQRTGVEVEFLVPGVSAEQADGVGRIYTDLYRGLWDQDESMMVGRQAALDRGASAPRGRRGSLNLGPLDALRASLPRVVEIDGQRFRILELEGELVAHSTLCPHRLGPLDAAPVEDGRIRCPWHGYVFEVRSGANAQGRPCRLAPAPQLRIDADRRNVELSWDAA